MFFRPMQTLGTTTLHVGPGRAYACPHDALRFLADKRLSGTVTIQLDAHDFRYSQPLRIGHIDADRIRLRGSAPVPLTVLAVDTEKRGLPTSVAPDFGVVLSLAPGDKAHVDIGDYVLLRRSRGALDGNQPALEGVFRVAYRWKNTEQITLVHHGARVAPDFFDGPLPFDALSAVVLPTRLLFAGSDGIVVDGVGSVRIERLLLEGDWQPPFEVPLSIQQGRSVLRDVQRPWGFEVGQQYVIADLFGSTPITVTGVRANGDSWDVHTNSLATSSHDHLQGGAVLVAPVRSNTAEVSGIVVRDEGSARADNVAVTLFHGQGLVATRRARLVATRSAATANERRGFYAYNHARLVIEDCVASANHTDGVIADNHSYVTTRAMVASVNEESGFVAFLASELELWGGLGFGNGNYGLLAKSSKVFAGDNAGGSAFLVGNLSAAGRLETKSYLYADGLFTRYNGSDLETTTDSSYRLDSLSESENDRHPGLAGTPAPSGSTQIQPSAYTEIGQPLVEPLDRYQHVLCATTSGPCTPPGTHHHLHLNVTSAAYLQPIFDFLSTTHIPDHVTLNLWVAPGRHLLDQPLTIHNGSARRIRVAGATLKPSHQHREYSWPLSDVSIAGQTTGYVDLRVPQVPVGIPVEVGDYLLLTANVPSASTGQQVRNYWSGVGAARVIAADHIGHNGNALTIRVDNGASGRQGGFLDAVASSIGQYGVRAALRKTILEFSADGVVVSGTRLLDLSNLVLRGTGTCDGSAVHGLQLYDGSAHAGMLKAPKDRMPIAAVGFSGVGVLVDRNSVLYSRGLFASENCSDGVRVRERGVVESKNSVLSRNGSDGLEAVSNGVAYVSLSHAAGNRDDGFDARSGALILATTAVAQHNGDDGFSGAMATLGVQGRDGSKGDLGGCLTRYPGPANQCPIPQRLSGCTLSLDNGGAGFSGVGTTFWINDSIASTSPNPFIARAQSSNTVRDFGRLCTQSTVP